MNKEVWDILNKFHNQKLNEEDAQNEFDSNCVCYNDIDEARKDYNISEIDGSIGFELSDESYLVICV